MFGEFFIYESEAESFWSIFPEVGVKERFFFGKWLNVDCDFSVRYLNDQQFEKRFETKPTHISGFGSSQSRVVPAFQLSYVVKF